jgi:hypothetical protein
MIHKTIKNSNKKKGSNSFVCAKTQFSRVNQLGNAKADSIVSQSEAVATGIFV